MQVFATSTNTIAPKAVSIDFPHLDIDFTFDIPFGWTPPSWYGYIENIVDPSAGFNNNIGGDYRFLQWRRWNNGSGSYVVPTDNGNTFEDLSVFGGGPASDCIIDRLISTFNNTIITGPALDLNLTNVSITNVNINVLAQSTMTAITITGGGTYGFDACNMVYGQISNIVSAFFAGTFTILQLSNLTTCNIENGVYSDLNLNGVTNCNIQDVIVNKLNINNCTSLTLALGNITDCAFSSASVINGYNLSMTGYNFVGDTFVTSQFPLQNSSKLTIQNNQATLFLNIPANTLNLGANYLNELPIGWKITSAFFMPVNITAGAGTIKIGTSANTTAILPISNLTPPLQVNTVNITDGFSVSDDNVLVTMAGGIYSGGNILLYINFAVNAT